MGTIAALSARVSRNAAARYAVAFLAAVIAVLVRRALNPVLGDTLPYITLFPALVFASWCCGVAPAFLSLAVGLLSVRYWFIPPTHSLVIPDAQHLVGMLVFACGAIAIIAIGEFLRRDSAKLHKAQGELEELVQQRTAQLNSANHSLGELTARLLHLQDEERRRIARELHDSVGQTLAALSMNLASVAAEIERLKKTAGTIADSAALVNDMSTDIRTISYLLHPPLLDEAGLSSALTWYIQGFSERSKIEVNLDVPRDFARLSRDLETAIFRVIQECLTNIHRHSQSSVANVRVRSSEKEVRIEVEDKGKGIPPEKRVEVVSAGAPGVGIRGMRERLRQLGGSLEINSDGNGKGTLIVARLPLVNASPAETAPATASAAAAGAAT
jgi:signal transduction histidine kinase